MRILHFLNVPFSANQLRSGGDAVNTSGGWMAALLARLRDTGGDRHGYVAFGAVNGLQRNDEDGVESFIIPSRLNSTEHGLRVCCEVIHEWHADIIHIHGTENCFGLLTARRLVSCPSLISIQGLMGPYSEWCHFFGNRSLLTVLQMHRVLEVFALRGQMVGFLEYKRDARREKEIIQGNRCFMGRTVWDRSYLTAANPAAKYYYGGELLRNAFWQRQWSVEWMRRHRIVFTNAGHPRKGAELLLNAVKLLQPDYPDIEVVIAGGISRRNGYGKFIRRCIAELGPAAKELGSLNAEQMAEELCKSHVFVSPSFIDNSPNAVCEAQLVGAPVISSYTGGVPSLIEDGRTGLFFPNGDVPMLAEKLREVFENDKMAMQLGAQARAVASVRHDPNIVVRDIVAAYEDILGNGQ